MQNKEHRLEIDGLRALAVISVILFHFFPNLFKWGFLGVDLFFVISGYLITKNINNELIIGKFTFTRFYLKRIKRILPATLLVLFITSAVSFIFLLAPDLVRFAQSQLSTLGFVANLYFWHNGGYFGTNNALKPLLHMWSLGVEEQFYLLFPLALLLIFKFLKRNYFRLFFLFSLVVISYFLNIYLLSKGGATPAFFLLPTRAWQFGLGAIFALLPTINSQKLIFRNFLPLFALSLVMLNFYVLIPYLPYATMMSFGAGVFLWQKWNLESPLTKFLFSYPIQFTGLISFSLYLWHWPVVVFLQYINVDKVPVIINIAGIALTFVLSFLSWKYVEQPFRRNITNVVVLKLVVLSYLLLILFSFSVIFFRGYPLRDSEQANMFASAVNSNFRCSTLSFRPYGGSRACRINDAYDNYTSVLVGNSHAQMYGPAYANVLTKIRQSGLIVPLNGCLPTISINSSIDCLRLAKLNFDAIKNDKHAKTVIIALTWYSDLVVDLNGNSYNDGNFNLRMQSLTELINGFKSEGKSVYLIGPISIPNYDFSSVASRKIKFDNLDGLVLKVPRDTFDQKFDRLIQYFSKEMGSSFLKPHDLFCDKNFCYYYDNEGVFFADSNHLSSYGVGKTNKLFEGIFIKNYEH